jgi:threonyl-tRNA synthetase
VVSISEKYEKYAKKVLNLLENDEIRALSDNRNETVGKKIRDAEITKIPFMIIVGENEEKTNSVKVRRHGGEDLGMITVDEFSTIIKTEINNSLKQFNV